MARIRARTSRILLLALSTMVLFLVVAQLTVAATQRTITLRLQPVAGSDVGGRATLTSVGGGTKVTLEVRGLAPGSTARASVHAGTLARPSASAAFLPLLKASIEGKARGAGRVLFRGKDDVRLSVLADGEHIILVTTAQGRVVAYGRIARPAI